MTVHWELDLAPFSGRDDRRDRAGFHRLTQPVSIVATIRDEHLWFGTVRIEQGKSPGVVGRLTRRYFDGYGQA